MAFRKNQSFAMQGVWVKNLYKENGIEEFVTFVVSKFAKESILIPREYHVYKRSVSNIVSNCTKEIELASPGKAMTYTCLKKRSELFDIISENDNKAGEYRKYLPGILGVKNDLGIYCYVDKIEADLALNSRDYCERIPISFRLCFNTKLEHSVLSLEDFDKLAEAKL